MAWVVSLIELCNELPLVGTDGELVLDFLCSSTKSKIASRKSKMKHRIWEALRRVSQGRLSIDWASSTAS